MEKEILIPEKIKNTLIGLSIQRSQIEEKLKLVLITFINAREDIEGNYTISPDFEKLVLEDKDTTERTKSKGKVSQDKIKE